VETQIDPFLASTVAAERTEQVEIGTAIAVAFARNPMTVAIQANDVQALSEGRFILGLGSQIRPHITKRFSMPWSKPAARMREFVLAIRAIWESWSGGDKLDFRGDFYTHTLMAPFFDPGPNPHGNPKIMMAAVGPLMTEAAGEVADGMLCHGFSTERYVREATLPALERGWRKAGRSSEDFEISAPGLVVARDTEEEIAAGIEFVKQQIAFYGSTPAYRPVLDLQGWGDLQEELNAMTKRCARAERRSKPGLVAAVARQGAEHCVPDRGGDPEPEAVVLEVMAHVLLAQALADLAAGDEVMQPVVGVVVDEVAGDEAAEQREGQRGAEDEHEEAEEERGKGDAGPGRHHQPQAVVRVVVVDAVDDEVHPPAEGVLRLPVKELAVKPVLAQGPDEDPRHHQRDDLERSLAVTGPEHGHRGDHGHEDDRGHRRVDPREEVEKPVLEQRWGRAQARRSLVRHCARESSAGLVFPKRGKAPIAPILKLVAFA
jgi:probable F420-dependent oxidoreductase